MKHLLLFTVIVNFAFAVFAQKADLGSASAATTERIKWYTLKQAFELNKTQPKKIFVDVFTDWCGWCKRMDATTFTQPQIVKYMNEKYYAVKFNAEGMDTITFNGKVFTNPNPHIGERSTHQLTPILLGEQLSYPSFVIFNEKNEVLNSLKGYMTPQQIDPVLKFFGEDVFKMNMWDLFMKCYQTDIK